MQLTTTILGFLNRVFNADPVSFLALRITVEVDVMTWSVADGFLTLTPGPTSSAAPMSIDLSQYTIQTLAEYVASQMDYIVEYQDTSTLQQLSALTLLDGSGDVTQSNGDHLYAYTSVLYAYINAIATELGTAKAQIPNAIAQMSVPTAEGEWLDIQGTYYYVPRNNSGAAAELDPVYAQRIVSNVLLPSGNNVGMAIALQTQFPGTIAVITDAILNAGSLLLRDGSIKFNSAFVHNSNTLANSGGLFDVTFAFDFSGPITPTAYAPMLIAAVNGFRHAGTYIRNINLKNGLSASTITSSYNIGPILVVIYDQILIGEDGSSISGFEDFDDQSDTDTMTVSQPVGPDAVQNAIGDAYDWSDETTDQDERFDGYMEYAVDPRVNLPSPDDVFDWTSEEPDEDDRVMAIGSAPVDGTPQPVQLADDFDWTSEEPDEDDRMSALNASAVGPDAPPQGRFSDDPPELWMDEGDEFYANHFSNADAPSLAAADPWAWFDQEDETIMIVNTYLQSDSGTPQVIPLVTESGQVLTTESGAPLGV